MNPEEQLLLQEVQLLRAELRGMTRLQRLNNFLTAAVLGLAGYSLWKASRRDDDQGGDLVLVVGADRRPGSTARTVEG